MELIPKNYKEIANDARKKVLELIFKAQTSHIGSNFSAIDIMAVLFEKADPQKDEIILSAGWKAAAWYYFLWRKGIITEEELNSFCQPGSKFIGLVEPMGRWGLRFAGGSMGYGLPAATGYALAKKLKGEAGNVYCLMSDGELQIGTTLESLLIINHHNLNNLKVIVDFNGLQAMGATKDILNVNPLIEDTSVIDGHNYVEIEEMLENKSGEDFIFAKTIKGKGISFMENNNEWHYRSPEKEEYEKALKELCQK